MKITQIDQELLYTQSGRIQRIQPINGDEGVHIKLCKNMTEAQIIAKQTIEDSGKEAERKYKFSLYYGTTNTAYLVRCVKGVRVFIVLEDE